MSSLQPLPLADYSRLPESLQALEDVTVGRDGEDIVVLHLPSGALQARRMKRACEVSLSPGSRVQLRSEHEDAIQRLKHSYEDARAAATPEQAAAPAGSGVADRLKGALTGGRRQRRRAGPGAAAEDSENEQDEPPEPQAEEPEPEPATPAEPVLSSGSERVKQLLRRRMAARLAGEQPPATIEEASPPAPEAPAAEFAVMGPGVLASELRGIPQSILKAPGLLLTREDGEAEGPLTILYEKRQTALAQKFQRICKIRMQQSPRLKEVTADEIAELQRGPDEEADAATEVPPAEADSELAAAEEAPPEQEVVEGLAPLPPEMLASLPEAVLKIESVALALEGETLLVLHAPGHALAARRAQRICASVLGAEAQVRPTDPEQLQSLRRDLRTAWEAVMAEAEQGGELDAIPDDAGLQRRILDMADFEKIPAALSLAEGVALIKEDEEYLIVLHTPASLRAARRLQQACLSYLEQSAELKLAEGLIIRGYRNAYQLMLDPEEAASTKTGDIQSEAGKTTVGRTVKDLIEHAAVLKATDVHIESRLNPDGLERAVIRYRVAGDMIEGPMELAGQRGAQVANWLFSQGRRSNPQWVRHAMLDGVADVVIVDPEGRGMRQVQLRLANLPEARGWDLIMRVLNTGQDAIGLTALGYTELQLELLREGFARPYGIIVFSGPTGSGKSTSMMAALETLPNNLKIISLEQPVERALFNTSHVTTRDEAELSRAIPSVNRWDGNLTVLGELRDRPSARALKDFTTSGKLTVVTLHASNALTVPTRMAELGVERSMLADPNFLVCLVNQRLVAKLCPDCRMPLAEHWDKVPSYRRADFEQMFAGEADRVYLRGPGCSRPGCRRGALGRVLCAEVVLIDDQDRAFIEKENVRDWRLDLLDRGWMPITSHALELVRAGQIDPVLSEQAVGPLSGSVKLVVDYQKRQDLLARQPEPVAEEADREAAQ